MSIEEGLVERIEAQAKRIQEQEVRIRELKTHLDHAQGLLRWWMRKAGFNDELNPEDHT